ncbi:MAG: DUF2946 family protein [Betaproteobacteria bacterium]
MDPIVIQSMAKWPNVPNVYGWLSLDRRGSWLIKGEHIANPGVVAFIGRNYAADEQGRWFFQNGPQRVFVTLEYTPWVIATAGADAASLLTHTGQGVERVRGAWLDETGSLLLRWSGGPGLVSDRDLAGVMALFTDVHGKPIGDTTLARAFDAEARRHATGLYFDYAGNRVPVGRIHAREVAQKFGFEPAPRPAPGEPEC